MVRQIPGLHARPGWEGGRKNAKGRLRAQVRASQARGPGETTKHHPRGERTRKREPSSIPPMRRFSHLRLVRCRALSAHASRSVAAGDGTEDGIRDQQVSGPGHQECAASQYWHIRAANYPESLGPEVL